MPALHVVYCQICTFPPEYCSYSAKPAKCKEWLRGANLGMFAKLYPTELTPEELSKSVELLKLAAENPQDDSTDAMDTAEKPSDTSVIVTGEPVLKVSKKGALIKPAVLIKRTERNKRKCITTISGLETFGVDLKKAAKLFAGKFACGSSLTKSPQGTDEITIQGDVQDQLAKLIVDTFGVDAEAITLKQGK
eukprot:Partr_v1_DN23693_c0_g1_i2_m18841 putative Density-regulated protein